ncbi:hypothetical protein WN943_022957 [Citrus x changshan-huyou]
MPVRVEPGPDFPGSIRVRSGSGFDHQNYRPVKVICSRSSKLLPDRGGLLKAVLKHLLHLGYENFAVDEAELVCHQQLQSLYNFTRAAKALSSFRAAFQFGTSHDLMENERETLLGILGDQVSEPLRVLINGAPLGDAQHLTHRYDKL